MTGFLKRYGSWIVMAAAFVIAPAMFTSGFATTIMSQMAVLIIFALAYNMLLGQGGMLSFGHAIYFGLAGYFSVHYLNLIGEGALFYFPVGLMPLFGGLVGLLFGTLIGYVSTRRAGTTFAMISLGFGEMITAMTLIWVAFFNGEEGIQTDRMIGPEPFGVSFGPDIEVYYLIAAWSFLCIVAMYALTRTPFGRMSNAVRDNPERAEFIGYNTQRVRWQAFALSSFFAGVAGSLHALNYEHVGVETVSIAQSGTVLFMAYIGGVGSFIGPILGAILITFLNSVLSGVTEAWYLYLGLLFVSIVMFAPFGLAGIVMMHEPIWKTAPGLLSRLLRPYAIAIGSLLVLLLGVVGLIEMFYFLSTSIFEGSVVTIYWMAVDTATIMPWIIYAMVAVVGFLACRRNFPMVKAEWGEVITEARARLVQ